MPLNQFIRGLLILLIITGCTNVYDVSYDYEKDYLISALETYDWLPLANAKQNRSDAIDFERIQKSISSDLKSKGLMRSSVKPDMLIEVTFGSRDQKRRSSRGSGRSYRYREGYLSIDFVDSGDDRLIWHGTARIAMEQDFSPEESERIISNIVGEIMKNFPPSGAK